MANTTVIILSGVLLMLLRSADVLGEKFICGNGKEIYDFEKCDGTTDCSDDSDENNCRPDECGPFGGTGATKYCWSTRRCYYSRTATCPCHSSCGGDQTCCSDGSGCFSKSQVCDDKNDCKNEEDEDPFHVYCDWNSISSGVSVGIIVAIVVIVLIIVVVVTVIVFVVCRRNQGGGGVVVSRTQTPAVTGAYYTPQQQPANYNTSGAGAYAPQPQYQQWQQQPAATYPPHQPATATYPPHQPAAVYPPPHQPSAPPPNPSSAPPPSYAEVTK